MIAGIYRKLKLPNNPIQKLNNLIIYFVTSKLIRLHFDLLVDRQG